MYDGLRKAGCPGNERIAAAQSNNYFRAYSGPSRDDPDKRAFRPERSFLMQALQRLRRAVSEA
jgi:hypothetical protein